MLGNKDYEITVYNYIIIPASKQLALPSKLKEVSLPQKDMSLCQHKVKSLRSNCFNLPVMYTRYILLQLKSEMPKYSARLLTENRM